MNEPRELVYSLRPDMHSRAAYILLRSRLKRDEEGRSEAQLKTKKMTIIWVKQPHIQSRAAYIKLRRKLTRQTKYHWSNHTGFRKLVLTKWEDERGHLECEYCKHGPLEIVCKEKGKEYRILWEATLDHVIPKDKDKSKEYDVDNVVVSCHDCNMLKDNMSLEEFQPRLDKKLNKIAV